MGSINFLGSYSGIDQSMIDQLMAAEKMPLVGMNAKVQNYETEKNAWKDINTRMNTLSTKINDLKDATLFSKKNVIDSSSGIVNASASNSAEEGNYEIQIAKLAKSTTVIGSSGGTASGDGKLNIAMGTETLSIDVSSGESLSSIVEKINSSENNSFVSASVIDSKIVLQSIEAGANTITIDDDDATMTSTGILSSIGLDSTTQTLGNNSEFTINGVNVSRNSNSITDVVEGLTFTLTSTGTTNLTVENDYSDLEDKIQAMVDQYNSTLSFMQSKSAAGTSGVIGSGGALSGDSSLQRLISNLRISVSDSITGITSQYKNASSVGIKTIDNEGTLSFDKTEFSEAMGSDADGVKNFFTEENGFVDKSDSFVDVYIDSSDGMITNKQTSLTSMIDTVNDKMDAFNLRMEAKEAYYIKIFASLDSYMAKAESTSSWLMSQFGGENSNG